MRDTIAYFLLLLYAVVLCKPVLPLLQDAVAHIIWQADHLATVHQNGNDNHAVDEMAHAAHEEESKTVPSSTKDTEPFCVFLVVDHSFPIIIIPEPQFFGAKSYSLSSPFLDKMYPPPKQA